jgi:peptide/nickel transport system permease protein
VTAALDSGPAAIAALSPRRVMLRRARSHVGFLAGGTIVLLVLAVAILAPWVAPYGPYQQDLLKRLANPVWAAGGSWAHPLGTDSLGRDLFSRMIWGARISLTISIVASVIAATIGTLIGLVGGYFGGRVDAVATWLINVKLALPIILVALAVIAIVAPSVTLLILILGFLTWDRYALVTRSLTQQMKHREFVLAAEAAGASSLYVMVREILPNLRDQIIVLVTLEVAILILIEAALSFLGLGVPPPIPSWGSIIADGRGLMFYKPFLMVVPGIAIFVLVTAINLFGDGIRDVTAPEGRA